MGIVRVVLIRIMRFVGEVEIVINPSLRERRAKGIDDEDHCNQEAEDFVCKSCGICDDSIEVSYGSKNHVDAHPDTNPGIENEEGDVQRLRQFVENFGKGKHWTCASVDHDGLPTNEGVDDATPCRRRDHLHGTDVVVGSLGVDCAERDGGRYAGEEEKKRYGQGLAVEIGEVLLPVLPQGLADVAGDASAPAIAIASAAPQDVVVMVVGLQNGGAVLTTGRSTRGHGRGEGGGRLLLPFGTMRRRRRRRRSGLCVTIRHGCIRIFTAVNCWILIIIIVVVVIVSSIWRVMERVCFRTMKVDGATGRDDLHVWMILRAIDVTVYCTLVRELGRDVVFMRV